MWKYIRNIINRKQFLLIAILFVALGAIVYAATYYRVNAGIAKEVDEFSICKKLSNSVSGPDTFVPTKTDTEWGAFISNAPGNISISACVVGGGGTPVIDGTRWWCDCVGWPASYVCSITQPALFTNCKSTCGSADLVESAGSYCSTSCNNDGC